MPRRPGGRPGRVMVKLSNRVLRRDDLTCRHLSPLKGIDSGAPVNGVEFQEPVRCARQGGARRANQQEPAADMVRLGGRPGTQRRTTQHAGGAAPEPPVDGPGVPRRRPHRGGPRGWGLAMTPPDSWQGRRRPGKLDGIQLRRNANASCPGAGQQRLDGRLMHHPLVRTANPPHARRPLGSDRRHAP
jgi:hypothetical protein